MRMRSEFMELDSISLYQLYIVYILYYIVLCDMFSDEDRM